MIKPQRGIRIREATLDDAEVLVNIMNSIIKTGAYSAFDTLQTSASQRDFIAHFNERGIFHVAECPVEKMVIGMQTLEPFADYSHAFDHVGIMGTLVDLQQRRSGIGTTLFEATRAEALKRGYEKIFTYVRADNINGLNYYRKMGFGVVGNATKQVKINGKYIDEIIIEMFI